MRFSRNEFLMNFHEFPIPKRFWNVKQTIILSFHATYVFIDVK